VKPFFKTQTLDQVHDLARRVGALGDESVALESLAGRTLARDLAADHDLPGFARSTMDGYAVQGRDTFGAGEGSPAYLTLRGEVAMGTPPGFALEAGCCARIGTGGMLPAGADAVVMVEHTRIVDERTIEVARSVAPGTNVLGPTDDAAQGQVLLEAGRRLRPQDVGLLAALGCTAANVIRRPRVGIISTGDEVVPVSGSPGPGQVRDVNAHTLAAQVTAAGARPVPLGLVPDDEEAIREKVEASLERCDLTLLSGGSSMGVRDLTVDIFLSFSGAGLLVHGVSVAPGKPFIWVDRDGHPLLGLPGQVASCMVAFHLFVEPILERMLGREAASFTRFARRGAVLSRNVPGVPGREAFQRVRVHQGADGLVVEPLFGKSGLIRTLTGADGLVVVPLGREGLDEGERVTVLLFP
jgi:molybdopterin molybdotransferase